MQACRDNLRIKSKIKPSSSMISKIYACEDARSIYDTNPNLLVMKKEPEEYIVQHRSDLAQNLQMDWKTWAKVRDMNKTLKKSRERGGGRDCSQQASISHFLRTKSYFTTK